MDKSTLISVINAQKLIRLPEKFVERDAFQQIRKHAKEPHTVIVTGVRRAGKSTILKDALNKMYSNEYYYLNFEDERLVDFTVRDFDKLHEVFVQLFGERKIFLFDEIQLIKEWERFVRRMQDSGYKFFITGSNASMLSSELGTRLTGRHLDVEIFPFSFREYLRWHNVQFSELDFYQTEKRGQLMSFFKNYLKHGGFPEFLYNLNEEVIKKAYDDILYKDIAVRYQIANVKVLRELALFLLSNPSCLFSYNSLQKIFNVGSVNTIKSYIHYFENSYLLLTVSRYAFSLKQQTSAPKKIYSIDSGLSRIVGFHFSDNLGRFLENIVFLELKRRNKEIFYYQTQQGFEIDFALRNGKKITALIQVAWELNKPETRKREFKALFSAMDELELKEAILLTLDESSEVEENGKKIVIQPVCQWLITN